MEEYKNSQKVPFEYSRSFLENIVVNSPVGIMMTDYDFNVKYMNSIAIDIHRINTSYDNINLKDMVIEKDKLTDIKNPLISEEETNLCITYEVQDNSTIRTIRANVNLARDENYYPIGGFFYICEDVTEIKRLRKKIRENEKVETIKEMIVTYNHEMNNILAVIIGKIELVIRKLSPDDENFKKLQDVLKSSKKLSEIIKKIKDTKTIKVKNYDNDTKMIDID